MSTHFERKHMKRFLVSNQTKEHQRDKDNSLELDRSKGHVLREQEMLVIGFSLLEWLGYVLKGILLLGSAFEEQAKKQFVLFRVE